MTGTKNGVKAVQANLPKPETPAQTRGQRPLPFLLDLDPTHSDGSNRRDNSKPTRRRQEIKESWSTREPSQEVQTQQRNQSPSRDHLSSHRPTQPSAPQADPAPFRPADPAVPELVTQFLFCQAGLRHLFPVHLPLGSVLIFPEGRVVEGAGSALARTPLRTRWSTHSDPTLLPGHPLPAHSPGPQPPGKQPALLHSPGRGAPPASSPPRPPPPKAPRRRRGRVAEREEGLEEGGSGSGPTCISVPAVSSGGGSSSRSLPHPPLRD